MREAGLREAGPQPHAGQRLHRGLVVGGDANRHNYSIRMPTGKVAVIELKRCLDGNNANIFECRRTTRFQRAGA